MRNNSNKDLDEQILWTSYINGSDTSLESIYRKYFDELYAYGNKWLKNPSLTEDSIQDLFIKLMQNRSNLSIPVSVKFYLFRAFRSIVLDKIKKENRMNVVDEPSDHLFKLDVSPEQIMETSQEDLLLKQKIADSMKKLTPRQREAIFLRYIEGFSFAEISEMMDISVKASYKLMARALDALKEQISPLLIYFLLGEQIIQ